VKEEIQRAGRSSVNGLMYTYPVHQAADILFCKGELVPVGKDQLPHLELTRSIARRFNERYAPVFPLPDPLLGEAPVLAGVDGRKMSKSLGNAIALRDDLDTIATKIRGARTDSDREITYDPEHRPEVANLITMAALASGRAPEDVAVDVGSSGAAALKAAVIDAVEGLLAPIRARRSAITDAEVRRVLKRGIGTATTIAEHTLDEVRTAMGMVVVGV
jgi:tryptophanyl-tRNA synthetase